jgi:dTDP-4-amino-4,6-dideoxygalactose transaminase
MRNYIPMLNVPRLHESFRNELEASFAATLDSGRFINGPAVTGFESELAKYTGVTRAIGVSSGTDALIVAMMGLGVQPGDEIITTPYTFFATAGSISRLGAVPVFVDIEPDTFNISPKKIAAAITSKTVGIVPVHLFGQCAQMDPINRIAKDHDLWVLEDAAQAIGAEYFGRKVGTFGNAAILSFFPAKNLGGLGDAGAVLTDDEELADKIIALREHGSKTKYHHQMVGGNFRMDALQAGFLSIKLPHLARWEAGRQRVAARYRQLLGGVEEVTLPTVCYGLRHVFNQHVITSSRRDKLQNALQDENIGCAIYYPVPLHMQECFGNLGGKEKDFPLSEKAAATSLALPIDPCLSDEEIDRVVATIQGGCE